MKSAVKRVFLMLGLFGLVGCSLFSEEEPLPYEWIQPGNHMVFDFHPVADTLSGPSGVTYGDTEGAFIITLEAAHFIEVVESRQGLKIACPEEIAYRMGYIDAEALRALAEPLASSAYGQYLLGLS